MEISALVPVPLGLVGVYLQAWRTLPQCSRTRNQRVGWSYDKQSLRTNRSLTGLFAGVSLEGTILIERKDANRDFYGSIVPAKDILTGLVPPPEVASKMYEIIEVSFCVSLRVHI